MMKVPNQYRNRFGPMGSDDSYGNCGAFLIPAIKIHEIKILEKEPPNMASKRPSHFILSCIADDGATTGWEHVSVQKYYNGIRYIPDWHEMYCVKNLFWDEEDCVIQFHPPKSEYVNLSENVLHLWRPINSELKLPPKELV